MKNKKLKKIPKFKNENKEFEFWSKNSVTDYFDIKKVKKVSFPNLKPTTKSISLRLPLSLLDDIKTLANKKDVPYQSLMKILLSQATDKELRHN